MTDRRLHSDRFPRSSRYHADWLITHASGGANPLWLAEWLAEGLELRPGLRVLDLGCGRACSSIFLRREFGVEVWAADRWFSPTENLARIRDAGVEDGVYPLHVEARALPFAEGFFDLLLGIDSFPYFGTDDLALNDLLRFVKPGGTIAIAGSGLVDEFDGPLPEHLRPMWSPTAWSLHSAAWWRRHWEKTGLVDVVLADTMPDGWRRWLEWQTTGFPDNAIEIAALEADRGRHLGYVRVVARRRTEAALDPVIDAIPASYVRVPIVRGT